MYTLYPGLPIVNFLKFNFIEVYLIYNVVLVSGIQQSDSVIHINTAIFFS